MKYDPEQSTPDWLPAIPPEDRWYEGPADPSPSLMRDLPVYPAEPAWADEEPAGLDEEPAGISDAIPGGWLALGFAVAVAALVYAADRMLGGR